MMHKYFAVLLLVGCSGGDDGPDYSHWNEFSPPPIECDGSWKTQQTGTHTHESKLGSSQNYISTTKTHDHEIWYCDRVDRSKINPFKEKDDE
jgi:hypothetical protein